MLVMGLSVSLGAWWLGRRRLAASARSAADRRAQVAEAVSFVAAELAVGQPPLRVLVDVGRDYAAPPFSPGRRFVADALTAAGRAGALGGDVPEVLAAWSRTAGADGLRGLAAAWQVAEATGAGLSSVLDRVAGGLRDQAEAERSVAVALAGATSSARLLAGLPLIGLAMGAGLGASPVSFLIDTGVGRVCLVVGLALEMAGLAWTDHLARAARLPALG